MDSTGKQIDQFVCGLAIPQKSVRKVSCCSVCNGQGHTKPTCPTKSQASTSSSSSSSSGYLKRSLPGEEATSKKKTSSTGSITVEDVASDDETDSNQSGFDEEEEGAVDFVNIHDQYDGGDAGNSDDDEEESPDTAPASNNSNTSSSASFSDALVWCNVDMMFLEANNLRSVPVAVLPPEQVPHAVGKVESLDSTLPIFKGRNSGSRVNKTPGAPLVSTTVDYFMLFWDTVIIGCFIAASNAYGEYVVKKWTTLTIAEFKSFLAIIIYFGVVKYPKRSMPWQKKGKYSNPWVRSVMKEYRFEQILKCWHWTDTSLLSEKERKLKNKQHCFWTVSLFLEMLAENCLKWYNPQWKANVDEGVFGFKGRHRARCYNPNKPWKWHFKSFCLNCSVTGYLMNFFMYMGKDEQRPPGVSATEYPVHRLLNHAKFQDINLVVATDNWYTSFKLAVYLLRLGIYLIGTVKSNSKGVPKDKVFKKTGKAKHNRGHHNCEKVAVDVNGVTKWVYFISWMDNKPVHFISTIYSKMSEVLRVIKEGGIYVGKRLIPIPTITMLYNKIMGGTDQFDQMLAYYRTTIVTKRWQTRIFTHFLLVAVVNASILYRLDKGLTRGQPGYDLLSFIDLLIDELATTTEQRKEAQNIADDELQKRYCGLHVPVVSPKNEAGNTIRQLCRVCQARGSQFCQQCDVCLCMSSSFDGPVSCFEEFHTRS